MPESSQPTAVGLLRALQRQFADLGNLATGKALELPDISFTHYRKLGGGRWPAHGLAHGGRPGRPTGRRGSMPSTSSNSHHPSENQKGH